MQPDFGKDFIEPSQKPVTRTTVAETTDYPKKAKEPVFFSFSNEFCRLENQMLNLEIFENVPEAFIYSEWSSWSNCNEENGQRSRTRFCSFYEGSEKFCEENMLSEKSACSNSKYCFKPPAYVIKFYFAKKVQTFFLKIYFQNISAKCCRALPRKKSVFTISIMV